MTAYYNENDPFAVKWLRLLIADGRIPNGDVDDRSITDVAPADLKGYVQCHFFAGVSGWFHGLKLAGWPDDRPVWTGSCPCQPFSAAGKGRGIDDDRHLWPAFRWLIAQCRPPVVFGEQVVDEDWITGVHLDFEAMGYALRVDDLPACSVGAPHKRQRLWWVGRLVDPASTRTERATRAVQQADGGPITEQVREPERSSEPFGRVANAVQERRRGRGNGHNESQTRETEPQAQTTGPSGNGGLVDPEGTRGVPTEQPGCISSCEQASPWSNYDLVQCADGKVRRVKPGVRVLVNGTPNRVGRLRGYGNAIVPQVAAQFIRGHLERECGDEAEKRELKG